jgi:hypothetical protein
MDFGAAGFMTVSPFTLRAETRRVCREASRQRVRGRSAPYGQLLLVYETVGRTKRLQESHGADTFVC